MPLSDANVIHENSGAVTTAGTSHVVSLAGADSTTAGNTVFVIIDGLITGIPAGFVLDHSATNHYLYRKSDVSAGETSWTFTSSVAAGSAWYVVEMSNIDPVEPLDVTAKSHVSGSADPISSGNTQSTGTTGLNAGLSTVVFASWASAGANSTWNWTGYTNGLTEVAEVPGTAGGPGLTVARSFSSGSTGTFTATATNSSSATETSSAWIAVYRAADAPVVAPLHIFAGFDWGTHSGIGSHNATSSMLGATISGPVGTFGTGYLIQAGSARNSTHGLRIVQSAGAVKVMMGDLGPGGTARGAAIGMNVRVVSGSGVVVVGILTNQGSTITYMQLVYDVTATKFGVRAGSTGTIQYQSGTTALNTWVWIDFRTRINTTTWQVDWRIETAADTYTDQTPATLSGQSATQTFNTWQFGSNTSQTMTADFDDVAMSRYFVAYPLGPHRMRILTVDPAGTPTTSGATQTWRRFTANGTLDGSFVAASVRDALDEVPPTISASADGVAGTTSSATDYLEIPMATYTCTATEFINGVRMLAPLWSGTGAGAGDLTINGYDGTTVTTLATASQITPGAPTAGTSTAPVWRTGMWQSTNGWTQAELDAAALRIIVPDGTPDMGVEALYLEVAIGKTTTRTLFGGGATAEVDPTRLGTVSIATTAPVMGTGNTVMEYEIGGTPTQVPITEGTTNTTQLNGVFESDVERVTVYWPPEPDPIA